MSHLIGAGRVLLVGNPIGESQPYIVASDPAGEDPSVVVVPVFTRKHHHPHETLILNVGDHPLVRGESVVAFWDARSWTLTDIRQRLTSGQCSLRTDVRADLLARLQDRLVKSRWTPNWIRETVAASPALEDDPNLGIEAPEMCDGKEDRTSPGSRSEVRRAAKLKTAIPTLRPPNPATPAVVRAEHTLRALHKITTAPDADLADQIREILAVGSKQFGLPVGAVLQLEGAHLVAEYTVCPADEFPEKSVAAVCDSFCGEVVRTGRPLGIVDAATTDWKDHPGYGTMGIRAYLGSPINVLGSTWGTVCFFDSEPATRTFGRDDFDLLDLIAKRVQVQLEHDSALTRLRAVLEGTSSATGTGFFQGMVKHLAQALSVDTAIVSELTGRDEKTARTLAVWRDGDTAGDFEIEVSSTPAYQGLEKGLRHVPTGAGDLFPTGVPLFEVGAVGFVGIPIPSRSGKQIGHLVATSRRRLDLTLYDRWLLEIFAARGGAELDRLRIDAAQRQQERVVHLEKLKSLGEFAGRMAHDFNDVLTGIIGHASLARRAVEPRSVANRRIAAIERAAERAEALTQRMMGYAGRGDPAVERLDLNAVVSEMSALLQRTISDRAILHRDLEVRIPLIDADAKHIRQILMDLVMSASDGFGHASGDIHLRTGWCEIRWEDLRDYMVNDTMEPGSYVYVEVEDNGPGMSEATRRQMFDPYSHTRPDRAGPGLSEVLGIVTGHQGGIRVESEPGVGTKIRIALPITRNLVKVAAYEREDSPAPESIRGGVLVVDDEALVLEVAQEILGGVGARVLTARDGAQAIEILREHPESVDLVLLDQIMPNMTGCTAANIIHDMRPGTPVLLMSGFDETAVTREFKTPDLAGFIQKPFKADTMLRAVSRIMSSVN